MKTVVGTLGAIGMADQGSSKRTALITGASAGIGAALADRFAAAAFDLVLVARRADRLAEVAAALAENHGCECRPLVADLADPLAPAEIKSELDEATITIDALINNAGYGEDGAFLEQSWAQHERLWQVMGGAVLALSHLFTPGMVARGYGRIVNVASMAGLIYGTAGAGLYGPIKAAVIHFSQSLALEVAGSGVHVTALCPGYTYSEFHDVMGNRDLISHAVPAEMWTSAEEVAEAALEAVMAGEVICVPGATNHQLARQFGHLPDRAAQDTALERHKLQTAARAGGDPLDPKAELNG